MCFHSYTYRMYIHIRSISGTLGTNGLIHSIASIHLIGIHDWVFVLVFATLGNEKHDFCIGAIELLIDLPFFLKFADYL